jgi:hypothetical protein
MAKSLSNIIRSGSTGTPLPVPFGGTGAVTLTGLVKGTGTTGLTAAVAGTDYQAPIGTISGIAKGNGTNLLTVATPGTDYLAPPTGTSLLKANSGGALANAVAGTDYLAAVAPGTSGNVLISNGTTWTSAALSLVPAWQIQATTYTASAKDYILANTSGGAFTITLPPSPAINDFVTIADYAGTFGTFNLTVNSNSLNLMGSVQTLVMNVSSRNVTLIYADATKGWVITL